MERVALRNGPASEWTTKNPVLLQGEEGLETDTRKRKTGNGNWHWNDLPYDSQGDISEDDLADSVLDVFGSILIPVVYNSGWPTLDSDLASNPLVGYHFLGGPAEDPPPASAGARVWDQTAA